MKIFLDTSSLIKLYHIELDTHKLDKIFEDIQLKRFFLLKSQK